MSLLQLKHISKSFSGVYANENIYLSVEKGEIHALLGENGAGKTTLVNIIFGLYTADSGEILWKGKPADFASPKEAIEAGVGMVQQHFSLVNKMTVLDNIILNLKGNSFFLDRAAARKIRITCKSRCFDQRSVRWRTAACRDSKSFVQECRTSDSGRTYRCSYTTGDYSFF